MEALQKEGVGTLELGPRLKSYRTSLTDEHVTTALAVE